MEAAIPGEYAELYQATFEAVAKRSKDVDTESQAAFRRRFSSFVRSSRVISKSAFDRILDSCDVSRETWKSVAKSGMANSQKIMADDRARCVFEKSAALKGHQPVRALADLMNECLNQRVEIPFLNEYAAEIDALVLWLDPGKIIATTRTSETDASGDKLNSYLEMLKSGYWGTLPAISFRSPPLDITKAYTELYFIPEDQRGERARRCNTGIGHEKRMAYIHADSLLVRTTSRAVITGVPGAGKTTFIRWLCQRLIDEGCYPLPVRLRAFADALVDDSALTLKQFAVGDGVELQEDAELVLKAIFSGHDSNKPVYLLDGWDEVPESRKQTVLSRINGETVSHRCFITSRPSGIPEVFRVGATEFYEIGPLTDYAVAELCKNYGSSRDQLPLIYELLTLLEKTPSLWAVVSNPYLLSLLCEVVLTRGALPDYASLCPYWVMKEAVALMCNDHNLKYPTKKLSDLDLRHVQSIAFDLSFAGDQKQAVFPASRFDDHDGSFEQSAIAASRLLNASHFHATESLYEFSHLRLQEFFAAPALKDAMAERGVNWVRQIVLSTQWQEELCFAASLASNDTDSPLWSVLRELIAAPDYAGEVLRRTASILATFGSTDGGRRLLGIDLREVIWARTRTDPLFVQEDVSALLRLDAEFLLSRTRAILPELKSGDYDDSRFIETVYRLVPFELRRLNFDRVLAEHSQLSWLVGLPSRAYPNIEDLHMLSKVASDTTSAEQDRTLAIRQLGAARAQSAVGDLLHLAGASESEIASSAIESLGKIGGKAAAMRMSDILINRESRDPSVIAATLNALRLDGYGVIEPYSRSRLVDEAKRLSVGDPHLEILLSAIEGVTFPDPPTFLFDLIRKADPAPPKTAKVAVALFGGVNDSRMICTALDDYIDGQLDPKISGRLIAAIKFVPVAFRRIEELWQRFEQLPPRFPTPEQFWNDYHSYFQGDYYLFRHFLRLFANTVARFPNHPLRSRFLRYIQSSLGDEEISRSPLAEPIIKSATIARHGTNVCQRLICLAQDDDRDDVLREAAIAALADSNLGAGQIDWVVELFEATFKVPSSNPGIAHALIQYFAERAGAHIDHLLATATDTLDVDLLEVRDLYLKRSQTVGNLIFVAHPIDTES